VIDNDNDNDTTTSIDIPTKPRIQSTKHPPN
jgi:hypothetical protein